MKKLNIAVMLTALIISSIANAQTYNRGMGIWQRVEVAENFSNPTDHYNFLKYGKVFKGMRSDLVYGGDKRTRDSIVWPDYVKHTGDMAKISLLSLRINLQFISDRTGGSLGVVVTNEKALEILLSEKISIGDMPEGDLTFDTYYQRDNSIGKVTRPRHFLKKVNQWEQCLYLNIEGYEPIPIRSAFCGNNLGTTSLVGFIKKKEVTPSSDKPKGKDIVSIIDCTPISQKVSVIDGQCSDLKDYESDESDVFVVKYIGDSNSEEIHVYEKNATQNVPVNSEEIHVLQKKQAPVMVPKLQHVEWKIVTD